MMLISVRLMLKKSITLAYLAVVIRLRPYRDAAEVDSILELDGNHEGLHLVIRVSRQLVRPEVFALLRQRIEGSTGSVKEARTCLFIEIHWRTSIDTYTGVLMQQSKHSLLQVFCSTCSIIATK